MCSIEYKSYLKAENQSSSRRVGTAEGPQETPRAAWGPLDAAASPLPPAGASGPRQAAPPICC